MKASATAQRLVGSSVAGLAGVAVNLVASLFLLPFLISHLGDEWYGAWVLIGTILGYFIVLDVGLFSAAERYVSLHHARGDWPAVNAVLSTSVVVFSVVGLVALVLVSAATLLVPLFVAAPEVQETVRWAMLICAVDLALFFPAGTLNGVVVARLRYDLAHFLQIGKIVLRTALIVYFISAGHGIVALAAITLATNTLERVAKLWLAVRLFPELSLSVRQFSWAQLREFVSYGIPSFIAEVADKIRFYVDTVVVGAMLSVSAVTLYNIAVRLVHHYIQVIAGSVGYLMPVFAAQVATGDHAALRRSLLFGTKIATAASLLVGGSVVAVGAPVIEVWIGEEYRVAAGPLAILVAGVAFELAQLPSTNLLFALGRQGFLARLGLIEAAANLAISLALVGPLGAIGVALGTTIPLVLLRSLVQPVYVCRQVDIPLARYAGIIARVTLPGLLLLLPYGWAIGRLDAQSAWLAIAAACALWPVLAVGLLFTAFDGGERGRLFAALPRWARIGPLARSSGT